MTASIIQQLSTLLGPDAIRPTEGYAIDGIVPQAVVRPANRQGVATVLSWAAQQGVKIFPTGGGVLSHLGNVPTQVDVILDLTRLARVVDYQPADLTATVEAGITLENLRRELAQGEKFVPLEAPLPGRATVGGILAAGFSGPMRCAYGLPRDWLIGISVVGANGVETKSGGRVVKNVTGYDLNKLYTGSLGTLGVIVEASFKLAPLPEAWGGLIASYPSLERAVAASRALIGQVYAPQGIQVVNQFAAERLGLTLPANAGAAALAFVAGRPRALARRLEESTNLLAGSDPLAVDRLTEPAAGDLLSRLTDFAWTADVPPVLGLKVSLPPNNAGRLLAALDIAADLGIVADPGFGEVQMFRWDIDSTAPGVAIMEYIDTVRRTARNLNGTAVVTICPPAIKAGIDVWAGSAGGAELEIMRSIKNNLDPAGILNPGRFIGQL